MLRELYCASQQRRGADGELALALEPRMRAFKPPRQAAWSPFLTPFSEALSDCVRLAYVWLERGWNDLERSGAIREDLESSGTIRDDSGRIWGGFGVIWSDLEEFGNRGL